jgi:hypothetical protein
LPARVGAQGRKALPAAVIQPGGEQEGWRRGGRQQGFETLAALFQGLGAEILAVEF